MHIVMLLQLQEVVGVYHPWTSLLLCMMLIKTHSDGQLIVPIGHLLCLMRIATISSLCLMEEPLVVLIATITTARVSVNREGALIIKI
ncbi:hypothetical protein BA188_22655 [Aeromonas hydrophila]|nr:hypothetical protein OI72_22470 [Aeromonas hydrophila]OFC42829.1 hypothetical protein BA189_22755 [Aeromonas hydrophila]OFC54632.1 hypothetical protein BA188_22655 [Aeromonas hydrophila]